MDSISNTSSTRFKQFSSNQNQEIPEGSLKSLTYSLVKTEKDEQQPQVRHFDSFIGECTPMKKVYQQIRKVAGFDSTVYISGASGTGKELAAKAIHYLSPRCNQRLVDINCAAIPQNLAESELFGHEQGAFTGALKSKPGKFELAHRGTLFLDEIGELSLELQAKLLRAIQEKKIVRVGGQKVVSIDVRIVIATNKNLRQEVAKGNFREDLFFRLNVFPITLPPLSDRMEDIPLLASYFLNQLTPSIPGIHPEALLSLKNHSWPGNVRELLHTIERAVILHEGNGPLTVESLFPSEYRLEKPATRVASFVSLSSQGKGTLQDQIERIEIQIIKETLNRYHWHLTETAEELNIDRKTLRRKIKKYGLTP